LETHEPSRIGRSAKPFFILVVHGPLGAVGHVAAPELSVGDYKEIPFRIWPQHFTL
jgi:hypothetical protein